MENRLEHLEEFKKILKSYRVSESGKEILASTELAMLVGPTSAGRNTIILELLKTGQYHLLVSDTTRHPRTKDGRPIEKNGREYWFRQENEVLLDLQKGKYIEAAIIHNQQVSGININELKKAMDSNKVAITDIEPNGSETIHSLKPEASVLFVVPPDFKVWLDRLAKRGAMHVEELRRRLESAANELRSALERDYYTFVVNDHLDDAVEQIQKHAVYHELDPEHDARGRATAADLLNKITEKLKSE